VTDGREVKLAPHLEPGWHRLGVNVKDVA
jgi:hypothetical protein